MKVELFRSTAKAKNDKVIELSLGPTGVSKKYVQNAMILEHMFEAFAEAMRKNGDEPVFNYQHKGETPEPAFRHALIFGYGRSVRNDGKSAVQDFRCNVINKLKAKQGHTICFDAGYFKTMGNYEYHRVGLNSPLGDGEFLHKNNNSAYRWKRFKKQYAVPWRDWTTDGDTIVIFLQPDTGFSMNHVSTLSLLQEWVPKIRAQTDKRIVARMHPKSHKLGRASINVESFCKTKKIEIHPYSEPMYPLLDRTSLCVTWNSTVSVETVAYGVPTVCMNDLSMAWDVTGHDLDDINNPFMPPREQWIFDLQHTQWTAEEIATGELWAQFKEEMARRDQVNGVT